MFDISWFSSLHHFNEGTVPPSSTSYDQRDHISLNGQWTVHTYKNLESVPSLVFSGVAPTEEGTTITVPSVLQLEGFGTPQYTNTQYPWDGKENLRPPQIPQKENLVAVYQKNFEIESQQRTHITFEGVESALALFLNGEFVGYKEDSFTPSTFDLTDHAKLGVNHLMAIVVHFSTGSWLEDQDFWRFSGIFRPVYLTKHQPCEISDIFVKTKVPNTLHEGTINIELTITGDNAKLVRIKLADAQDLSQEISEEALTYTPKTYPITLGKFEVSEGLNHLPCQKLSNPKLWSAETPLLYGLEISLLDKDEHLLDHKEEEFGLRRFAIDKKVMTINGKRIIFHGINRHEFSADKGRAIGYEEIKNQLFLLKRNNINAIRTSHYPNQEMFYRLADRMGFYVIDETNLESHGTGIDSFGQEKKDGSMIPGCHEEWKPLVMDRAKNMVQRDKNHPSILFWSCGNESFDGSVIMEESNYFRSLHDGRLVHYENVRIDSPYKDISDIESQMYTKPEEIETFLTKHPDRPFILCEYNHAMGNSCGGLKLYTDLEDKIDQYQGGFIWDFMDQALTFLDGNVHSGLDGLYPTDQDFCCNGVFFSDKPEISAKANEVKKLYAPIVLTMKQDSILVKNKQLFLDTSDLILQLNYLKNGNPFKSEKMSLGPIKPNQEKKFALTDYHNWKKDEEIVVNAQVIRTEQKPWFAPHSVIVSASKAINNEGTRNPLFIPLDDEEKLPIIDGKDHFGAQAKDSQFLVNKVFFGSLVGILQGDTNILKTPINIETWRAPISNEMANGSERRWRAYKTASLYKKVVDFGIHNHDCFSVIDMDGLQVKLTMSFSFANKVMIETEIIRWDHTIYSADLPCFGLSFGLDDIYDTLYYYGNINGEAYSDRKESCIIGRACEKVEDQGLPYIRPQETGNKTDMRCLDIVNKDGKGLRITTDTIFEASVLKWSCHELENAWHQSDLPHHTYNVVRILHGSCGIGGDDTWGAPVHNEYLYHGPQKKWRVTLELI